MRLRSPQNLLAQPDRAVIAMGAFVPDHLVAIAIQWDRRSERHQVHCACQLLHGPIRQCQNEIAARDHEGRSGKVWQPQGDVAAMAEPGEDFIDAAGAPA